MVFFWCRLQTGGRQSAAPWPATGQGAAMASKGGSCLVFRGFFLIEEFDDVALDFP